METAPTSEQPAEPAGGAAGGAAEGTAARASDVATPPTEEMAGAAPAPTPLPAVADGVLRSLDPRAVRLDRLVGWIATAILGGIALVVVTILVLVAPFPRWLDAVLVILWALIAITLAWSAQRWPEIAHRHAFYRVDADGIEIRRGVLWRAVINVPRSRVQHTDVSQGPLERGHGLGTLVIYTAGTDHSRVDLHGLAHEVALAIRDHLLPHSFDPESHDAV